MGDSGYKLVSLVLLLGMLAAPAAALSGCLMPASNAAHQDCLPDCPMMAKTAEMAADNLQAQPQNSNCCQVSPGRPVQVAPVLVPPDARISQPAVQMTAALDLMVAAPVPAREAAPPSTAFLSQAVLCTFLI